MPALPLHKLLVESTLFHPKWKFGIYGRYLIYIGDSNRLVLKAFSCHSQPCDKRASAAYKVFLHTFVFELQGLWQFYLSSIISLSDTLGPKDIAKEY